MEAVILLIVLPFSLILNGLVLKKLWGWFVVANFGLKPLSIPSAIGIALIVSFLTYPGTPPGELDIISSVSDNFYSATTYLADGMDSI